MERNIYRQRMYLITNKERTLFLCHGEEACFAQTKNIQYAAKIWPEKKVKQVLKGLLLENPITPLTEILPIIMTYSIIVED